MKIDRIRADIRAKREAEHKEYLQRVEMAEKVVNEFFSIDGNAEYKKIIMFAMSINRHDSGDTLRNMVIFDMEKIVRSYKNGDTYEMDKIIEKAEMFGLI